MQNSKILKGTTLVSFISLMSAFLLYRGGYLDSFIYSKNKKKIIQENETVLKKVSESISAKKDSLSPTRLPSSKSIVLTDNNLFVDDTANKKANALELTKEQIQLLSSSKSISPIINPTLFIRDTPNRMQESKTGKKKQ